MFSIVNAKGKEVGKTKALVHCKSLPIGNKTELDSVLENRVAVFLIARKADKSLGEFADELKIPKPSLKRYIDCSQSMTLRILQKIALALKVQAHSILTPPKR